MLLFFCILSARDAGHRHSFILTGWIGHGLNKDALENGAVKACLLLGKFQNRKKKEILVNRTCFIKQKG